MLQFKEIAKLLINILINQVIKIYFEVIIYFRYNQFKLEVDYSFCKIDFIPTMSMFLLNWKLIFWSNCLKLWFSQVS